MCISGGGISYRDNLMIYGHTPAHIHVWIRITTRALINDILVILKLCKQNYFHLNKITKLYRQHHCILKEACQKRHNV